jgi:hypothetical protein
MRHGNGLEGEAMTDKELRSGENPAVQEHALPTYLRDYLGH